MKFIRSPAFLFISLASYFPIQTLAKHRVNQSVEEVSKQVTLFPSPMTEVVHVPATTGADSDSTASEERQSERVLVVVHRSHHLNQVIAPPDVCAGVLVAPRIVITAAHCFYDSQRFPHMFGVTHKREGGIFWDVTRNGVRAKLLVAHPGYREIEKLNDIGAMRLETAVCGGCLVPMTGQSIPMSEGTKMEMIVFLIENEHNANIRIDRIPVRWTSKFVCGNAYQRWGVHISPKQICIESLNLEFSHRGESAVLLVNEHPIGVLSFKLDVHPSSNGLPYIYTDLTRYSGFIQREIRNDAIKPYRICSSILYVVISLGVVQ